MKYSGINLSKKYKTYRRKTIKLMNELKDKLGK